MTIRDDIVSDRLFCGSDITLAFEITQSDGTTPQDVSGWTIEFVARKSASTSATPLFTAKTIANSGIVISNGNGQFSLINVLLQRADTLTVQPGSYSYSLWRVDAGFEIPLAVGKFVLTAAAKA